ncbi:MAG: glutamate-5-semialdehyde dehydrogenase, partial [Anaerolineales bacterium]|nr:glutamate-5-semialdehyde dehydrogenase [Anaerolineales bacterium]
MTNLTSLGQAAKAASYQLALLTTAQKNEALLAIAAALENNASVILAANAQDVADGKAKGLSDSLLDRLLLNEQRLAALAADTRRIATLSDPVGSDIESRVLPNGMRLVRRRIPIGVLGVIYEARPNVTIDIATLSLKTGNAVILRGGSETLRSNLALVSAIQAGLNQVRLPATSVQYIDNPDRALITQLLKLDQYVDMIIPRGGAGLHRLCKEESTIPVITGGIGICHVYVDESADLDMALQILLNAKVQRPSVCNALDTVLVHPAVANALLPALAARLAQSGVELRATGEAYAILSGDGHGARVLPAGPDDFDQEWLALILGIHLVADVEEAIAFIQAHTTEHTESILTNDWTNATRFVDALSSSAVFVNASTRFNDGGQFGLGAEVAVST